MCSPEPNFNTNTPNILIARCLARTGQHIPSASSILKQTASSRLHCIASYPTMLHSVSHPLPTFGFCYFQSAGSIDAILSRPPKTSLPVTIHKGTSAVSRTLAALVQTREKKRDRFRKIFAFSTRRIHTLSYQMNPPADAEKPTHPTIPGTT